MPPEEAALIAAAIGSREFQVSGDEFGLDCRTPDGGFHLAPRGEIGALPSGKPEEVIRLGVNALAEAGDASGAAILARFTGPVTRVAVLRTAVWFSAPRAVGETRIRDAVVPAGQQTDVHLSHPAAPAPVGFPEAGLNVVDSALCFQFARGGMFVVGTDGWSYRLALADGAEARAWVAEAEEVPLADLNAESREAAG